jgi:glyoxylase-like metal-dependent hydrolase (beta-lactamase superfamily II)
VKSPGFFEKGGGKKKTLVLTLGSPPKKGGKKKNLSFRIHALQISPLGFHARRGKRHKRFFVGDFLFAESDCPGRFPVSESDYPGLGFHARRGKKHKRFFVGDFLFAEFDCPGRFRQSIKTWNRRRTDRRTHML